MTSLSRGLSAAGLLSAFVVTLVVGNPQTAQAQDDGQLWLDAGLRYRPIRPLRITFEQRVRFDEDISRVESVIPQLVVSYDPIDFLRISLAYRFIWSRGGSGEFEDAHRLHLDARFRGEVDRVELSYRLRFQERLQGETDGLDARHTFRNRFGIAVDTDSPVTPSLSAEIFTRVGSDPGVSLPKFRITIGLALDVDDHTVDVFYRFEAPIEDQSDPRLHILGVAYRFDLPRPSDEEEEPEPEIAGGSESEAGAAAGTPTGTETEAAAVAETESAAVAETEVAAETETEVAAETETEAETEAAAETETDSAAEAETESAAEAETESAAETESESNVTPGLDSP